MTIASQLTLLNSTKTAIKTAIENKGATVGTVPFADYPAIIDSITGGGGLEPTITPIVTGVSVVYFSPSFTILNWSSYIDPNASCSVVDGSGQVVIPDSQITLSSTGVLSLNPPSTDGTYFLKVQVQEFGLAPSIVAAFEFTKVSASFRYWRITGIQPVTDTSQGFWVMLRNWRLYTGEKQTGTMLPPDMTSATAPTPYVVTSSPFQTNATYADWKAFDPDISGTTWWLIGISTAQTVSSAWITIDLGSETLIKSMKFSQGNLGYQIRAARFEASNTGQFAGEQTNLGVIQLKVGTAGEVTLIG